MELPFVRLSLTNEIEEQLTTDEILDRKLREIKLSNSRAKLRLRQNSKLIQPKPACDREPEPYTSEIEPNYIGDSNARQKMLLKSSQKSEFWASSSGSEEETEVSIQPVQEELVQHVRSRIKPKKGIDLYAESKMIEL